MQELAKQTGGTKGAISTKDRSPEVQMLYVIDEAEGISRTKSALYVILQKVDFTALESRATERLYIKKNIVRFVFN